MSTVFTHVLLQIIEEDPLDSCYYAAEYGQVLNLVPELIYSTPTDRRDLHGFFGYSSPPPDSAPWTELKPEQVLAFQREHQCLFVPCLGYE